MSEIQDLRTKTPDELKELVGSLRKELFNLRFQMAAGETSNTSRFRVVRREIARAKTIINENKQKAAA